MKTSKNAKPDEYSTVALAMVRKMMDTQGITFGELAGMLSRKHPDYATSTTNLTNKLYKGTIRFSEMYAIMDTLGYNFFFEPVDPESGGVKELPGTPGKGQESMEEMKQTVAGLQQVTQGLSSDMENVLKAIAKLAEAQDDYLKAAEEMSSLTSKKTKKPFFKAAGDDILGNTENA